MVSETLLQQFKEQMDLKVCRLEENCRVSQQQVQKYQEELQQHKQSQQQRLSEEFQNQIDSNEKMALLQVQMQQMQDAAAAAALESSASSEQLQKSHKMLEDRHKEIELLQQDRNLIEITHHQQLLEKDEVIDCLNVLLLVFFFLLTLLMQRILALESQLQQLQVCN